MCRFAHSLRIRIRRIRIRGGEGGSGGRRTLLYYLWLCRERYHGKEGRIGGTDVDAGSAEAEKSKAL